MQGMTSTPLRLSDTVDLSSRGRFCAKWALAAGLLISIAPAGLEYATLTRADSSALESEELAAAALQGGESNASGRTAKRPTFGFVLNGSQEALDEEQHNVAHFLASRYRRSADQIRHFVSQAYQSAAAVKLDPWLVLAVMAVESGFDPFAESSAGAQGLMQILTRVNLDRLAPFGGAHAVFDPITNIRVGTDILHMLLNRNGSIEGALKSYVGAANLPSDGGYAKKVLGVRDMIAAAAGVKAPARAAGAEGSVQIAARENGIIAAPQTEAGSRGKPAPAPEPGSAMLSEPDQAAERVSTSERAASNP